MIKAALLVLMLAGHALAGTVVVKHKAAGGAFCSGSFVFCDDFSSASDPPTNWTEVAATTWINTGTTLTTPTSGTPAALYRTTNMGSSDMYAVVKFVNNAIGDMGLVLRLSTTGSTYADIVYYGGGKMWWGLINNTGAFIQDVGECTYTPVAGDYLSASVAGTGTTRVIKLWVSTTAPTGAPSGTATCTWTGGTGVSHTSPASASACTQSLCTPSQTTDVGLHAGVWIATIDSNKVFDDFAAGP